jgi:hypothetical protein
MNAKEKKSAKELQAMIMQEAQKHPDWDIASVAISRHAQSFPHLPNWDAQFTMKGRNMAPPAARQFTTELSNRFDLA